MNHYAPRAAFQPFALLLALLLAITPGAAFAKKKAAVKPASDAPPGGAVVQYQNRADVQAFIAEMAQKHGFVESELKFLFSRVRFYPSIIESMMLG